MEQRRTQTFSLKGNLVILIPQALPNEFLSFMKGTGILFGVYYAVLHLKGAIVWH